LDGSTRIKIQPPKTPSFASGSQISQIAQIYLNLNCAISEICEPLL